MPHVDHGYERTGSLSRGSTSGTPLKGYRGLPPGPMRMCAGDDLRTHARLLGRVSTT